MSELREEFHRRQAASLREETLQVVRQSDYETVLRALRDYIRIIETPHETYGTDETSRLAAIRELAKTAEPCT